MTPKLKGAVGAIVVLVTCGVSFPLFNSEENGQRKESLDGGEPMVKQHRPAKEEYATQEQSHKKNAETTVFVEPDPPQGQVASTPEQLLRIFIDAVESESSDKAAERRLSIMAIYDKVHPLALRELLELLDDYDRTLTDLRKPSDVLEALSALVLETEEGRLAAIPVLYEQLLSNLMKGEQLDTKYQTLFEKNELQGRKLFYGWEAGNWVLIHALYLDLVLTETEKECPSAELIEQAFQEMTESDKLSQCHSFWLSALFHHAEYRPDLKAALKPQAMSALKGNSANRALLRQIKILYLPPLDGVNSLLQSIQGEKDPRVVQQALRNYFERHGLHAETVLFLSEYFSENYSHNFISTSLIGSVRSSLVGLKDQQMAEFSTILMTNGFLEKIEIPQRRVLTTLLSVTIQLQEQRGNRPGKQRESQEYLVGSAVTASAQEILALTEPDLFPSSQLAEAVLVAVSNSSLAEKCEVLYELYRKPSKLYGASDFLRVFGILLDTHAASEFQVAKASVASLSSRILSTARSNWNSFKIKLATDRLVQLQSFCQDPKLFTQSILETESIWQEVKKNKTYDKETLDRVGQALSRLR